MPALRLPLIGASFLTLGFLAGTVCVFAASTTSQPHHHTTKGKPINRVAPAKKGAAARKDPWSLVKTPFRGVARVIGTYTAGCLAGAQALPLSGIGYQVMHPSRQRYYGHPSLIRFIEDLGRRAQTAGVGPVLIGDMSQPRGGPAPTGHASHQIGLDVDIWLSQPEASRHRTLTPHERETIVPVSVVAPNGRSVNRNWNHHTGEIIKLSALSPQVERIFVNPAIKQELCREYPGASWLHKVRPWWLHEEHEHVRLYGPPANPLFHAQLPVAAGSGCDAGTFRHWFALEGVAHALAARLPHPKPTERKMPVLPAACNIVLRH